MYRLPARRAYAPVSRFFMATVLVVTSAPPLVEGGHLMIARSLERALLDAGHRAAVVTTPSNRFGRQASAYLANWLTDVGMTGGGEPVDQVISLRFPSFAVRHDAHVSWLNHTMREYYDLWDDFSAPLSPQARIKEHVRRQIIHTADSYLLSRVSKVFAQSRTVQERLAHWNGIRADVVWPPPPPRPYRCDGYGDYLFVPSRLAPLKRMDLVLRALAHPAAAGVRCVIGGDGEARAGLVALSRDLGVDARVMFAGWLSDADLVGHLAACRAVVFVPKQEDYGFVTAEAFASAKAVITCRDSGGPLDLVRHGENGWIVDATPAALAAAFAEAMTDAARAERYGIAAQHTADALTWDGVVKQLVIA